MIKTPFRLAQDQDGWPPFGSEWLPLLPNDRMFINTSPPLFISGLSVDDVISLNEFDEEGFVIGWSIVKLSKSSVMWISDIGGGSFTKILSSFRRLGCHTVVLEDLYHASVHIPSSISLDKIDNIIGQLSDIEYAIAFPSNRHDVL
jgi:hypothetical protein